MTEAARDRLALIRLKAAAIIPAYREEKHIGDVVRRTRQQLDHVLVVDDGSNDQTAQRAREAGAEVIVHSQNRGKGEAIKTGLRHWLDRQFTHVVVLDADGQHLPEEIDRFIAAAASAAEPSQSPFRTANPRHAMRLSHAGSPIDSRAPRRREPLRLRNRNAYHCQPQRLSDRISSDYDCLLR